MSPTVYNDGKYRFYFFSREESRMHVHVACSDGEAKFWIEPVVALAESYKLTPKQLNELHKNVENHKNEIKRNEEFPWFKNAPAISIFNVKLLHIKHLHWPDLDVDLDLDSLANLESYPLIYAK